MNLFDINTVFLNIGDYKLSYVEFFGCLFGLISVYLAAKEKIATWPTGIINEFFFFLLFYQSQLYADMMLQLFFFGATVYGWYYWRNPRESHKIGKLSQRSRMFTLIVLIIGTFASGFLLSEIHNLLPILFPKPAVFPFIDSFVMTGSILATILLARKKTESWWLWISVDIVCVIIYFQRGILFLSTEYFIFLLLAITGLINWNKKQIA